MTSSPAAPRVSVVVPALNEERNLPYVFGHIPPSVHEVILVDGGSTDNTVAVARGLWPALRVVRQTRKGKGNALACGFAHCTGDIIVMIDADGSTDPAEIPRFVQALVDGADFAKGSRFRRGGGSHDITRFRRLGNYGLNAAVNLLFRTRYTDLCYGYNAFWRRLLPYLELPDTHLPMPADGSRLWGDGFEIETLINVRVAAHRLKISEVASVEHERIHGVSNLNAPRDGIRVLRTIVVEFRRRRRQRRPVLPQQTAAQRARTAKSAKAGLHAMRADGRTAAVAAAADGTARMAPALPSIPRQRTARASVVARHPVPEAVASSHATARRTTAPGPAGAGRAGVDA